jgi:hypothetical protein
MSDIVIVKTERIYKTSEALRRAVNKYNLNQVDYKQISKNNYLSRREHPEYVLYIYMYYIYIYIYIYNRVDLTVGTVSEEQSLLTMMVKITKKLYTIVQNKWPTIILVVIMMMFSLFYFDKLLYCMGL